jgi:hypothetical protein
VECRKYFFFKFKIFILPPVGTLLPRKASPPTTPQLCPWWQQHHHHYHTMNCVISNTLNVCYLPHAGHTASQTVFVKLLCVTGQPWTQYRNCKQLLCHRTAMDPVQKLQTVAVCHRTAMGPVQKLQTVAGCHRTAMGPAQKLQTAALCHETLGIFHSNQFTKT